MHITLYTDNSGCTTVAVAEESRRRMRLLNIVCWSSRGICVLNSSGDYYLSGQYNFDVVDKQYLNTFYLLGFDLKEVITV